MSLDLDGWRCACGYTNTNDPRCVMCNARAPAVAQARVPATAPSGLFARLPEPEPAREEYDEEQHDWRSYYAPTAATTRVAGRKATRTVLALIFIGVVVQVVAIAIAVGSGMAPADAIKVALFSGLVMYGIEAVWVLGRSAELGVRPKWLRGGALMAVGEGVMVGGGLAVGLTLALRLITGQPALDEVAAEMASEGGLTLLLFGVLLAVVAAPVVEELVFRGFLAEAFRNRGKSAAIVISAVVFSFAHLSFSQFRYYVAIGIVLGVLYWRRGLLASISAHAAFNGMLVLFAVIALTGPATTVDAGGGSTMTLPANWRVVEKADDQIVAQGPSGATMVVMNRPLPRVASAQELAPILATGVNPSGAPICADAESAGVMALPAGEAVTCQTMVEGVDARLVMITRGAHGWIVILEAMGSERAAREFEEILWTWRLPAA